MTSNTQLAFNITTAFKQLGNVSVRNSIDVPQHSCHVCQAQAGVAAPQSGH